MEPLDSVEVRWFGELTEEQRTALPSRLEELKDKGFDVGPRPDQYILVPTSRDFGLKVRGAQPDKQLPAKLEFKGRTARLGTQRFDGGILGNVELWTKWSYESPDALKIVEGAKPHRVSKTRCQVKLRWNAKFQLERLQNAIDPISKGGAFEITLAQIDVRSFWTIGAEAFPHDSETVSRFGEFVASAVAFLREENLTQVIPLASLTAETSRSYPDWLAAALT